MRSAMNAAAAALSLPPCSMSWSVAARSASRSLSCAVPVGDAGVEVPAVEVEPGRVGDRADLVERLVLEDAEADDDVGDLDAGIVDVVLHFDRDALEAQDPDQRVAERGVAQVADVRRLVRIDRRVLDDRLAGRRRRRRRRAGAGDRAGMPAVRGRSSGSRWGRRRPAGCPSSVPKAWAISWAMARGALRSRRASSNATGVPRSPSSRLGGYSRTSPGSAASSRL